MGAGGLFAGGAAASLLGTAFEVQGLLAQGDAAKQRGDYQAAILRQNAQFNRESSLDTFKRGQIAVQRQQTTTSQVIGRQRAALAANGILVDTGSAVDLVVDTARAGKQAELDIQGNAERAALQLTIDALNNDADANLAQFTGEAQRRASRQAIPGTILTGVGRVATGAASFRS